MIKIIKKLFNTKEEVDNSTVEVKLELPIKAKEELFDDAVRQLVRQKLKSNIKEQLIEMCYTKEEVVATKAAIATNPDSDKILNYISVLRKNAEDFPHAQIIQDGYTNLGWFGLDFDFDKFVNNIIENELEGDDE